MEYQIIAIAIISAFTTALIILACAICYDAGRAADVAAALANEVPASELRYTGELYLRNADKSMSAYFHTGTGAAYYKQGIQFRSAVTGRIVSTSHALAGL